ncbi:arylamine N-acetyltransferase family protein [Saccharopolyspora spinosa]|uniref:N-hydroxyarylamine O-acetyltransferase n=1 Tax=Saccharopolyspora spinosa TaxID=60894 RepID=A0A2N3XZL5_SACSN|nr:arylamine N-acetyltransferase [Saccharopolyspora spinosa]PKW16089.1 N-hydroxyarylamine O-acetyltransferase [Saccharopolyspora spinosa]
MLPALAEHHVDAYLARIGADRPDSPDLETLRHLQERHVLSIPFETIALYTGEPVPHTLDAVQKIVAQQRGGCCLELNSAFGMLLGTFGYQVELLHGQIYRNSVLDKGIGHMALGVTVPLSGHDQVSWLVDVGQGNNSRHPLRIDLREPQPDPHGTYLLTTAPEGDFDVSLDGILLYRLETRGRDVEYGSRSLWWYRTSPRSPFAAAPISIARTERGKRTLRGKVLIEDDDGRRTLRRLDTDEALLKTYHEYFGIELDRVPSAQERVSTAIATERNAASDKKR